MFSTSRTVLIRLVCYVWPVRGKRDNFSSYERFGSPTRDSSRRGECHVMPRFRILKREIRSKEVKSNSAKHTVIG